MTERGMTGAPDSAKPAGFKDPAVPTIETANIIMSNIFVLTASGEDIDKLKQMESTGALRVAVRASEIIESVAKSKEPQTLSLAVLDARTMGLHTEFLTNMQVWEKGKEFGDRVSVKAMVRLAVGAANGEIRVERDESLVGIVQPITPLHDFVFVWYVERRGDGKVWLAAYYANLDSRWNPNNKLVVSLRK